MMGRNRNAGKPGAQRPGKTLKRIFAEILSRYKFHCLAVVLCLVVSAVANVRGTLFMQTLIDDYITPMMGQENPDFGPLAGAKFTFMGGHPMAGREFSGFDYAKDDLFENASMILVPAPGTDVATVQMAKDFFLSLGFGRVRFSTPQEHDEMIALTSQLAHIVSSAYVKSPLAARHKGFSAGSFLDMTRVARLNEDMWTELFFDNADMLSQELGGIIERLEGYKLALDTRATVTMKQLLREGREAKEALDE